MKSVLLSLSTGRLFGDSLGALVPVFTLLGPQGLYSPYFGLVPDYEVGFAILSEMVIALDGLSSLSVTNWTTSEGVDVRAAFAKFNGISPEALDFRLHPTNLVQPISDNDGGGRMAYRAVFQDKGAPVDAGTPTCITWRAGIDSQVYRGIPLDEFVFELDAKGFAIAVEAPALQMQISRQ